MALPFTESNFLALIESAEGTPYKYGGIDPFHGGADCSGLIYWAGLQCGVTLARSTEAEWASYPRYSNWQDAPVGAPIEFEVPGDGGSPPQHVGVNLGGGYMIDDPHTGTVVKREAIPNVPGVIWPIGWVQLPFVSSPAPTPTPAPPAPTTTGASQMIQSDPETGGYWTTDPNGDVGAYRGAPFIPGLNTHPEWHAGKNESGGLDEVIGLATFRDQTGHWGLVFQTAPTNGYTDITQLNYYHMTRAGQPD